MDEAKRIEGRLTLFGFKATTAELEVVERTKSWRVTRAFGWLALCLGLVPVVALIPPHIPWVIGAVAVGAYLFYRHWTQERTLVGFRGTCPKCGAAQTMKLPDKLAREQALHCPGCGQTLHLEVGNSATGIGTI